MFAGDDHEEEGKRGHNAEGDQDGEDKEFHVGCREAGLTSEAVYLGGRGREGGRVQRGEVRFRLENEFTFAMPTQSTYQTAYTHYTLRIKTTVPGFDRWTSDTSQMQNLNELN